MTLINLKNDDEVVDVKQEKENVIMISKNGYYLVFKSNLIPMTGLKSGGVKGINLKDDVLVSGLTFNNNTEYLNIFTDNKTAKRVKTTDLEELTRAKKGSRIIKNTKTVIYNILKCMTSSSKDIFGIKLDNEMKELKNSEIPIMDISSTGSVISKEDIIDVFKYQEIFKLKEEKAEIKINKPNEESIKEMTINDFLDDFKL